MVCARFLLGCVFPGLIVFAIQRKKTTTRIATVGMLLCGLASITDIYYLSFAVALIFTIFMNSLSRNQVEDIDCKIRDVIQTKDFSRLFSKNSSKEQSIHRYTYSGTSTPVTPQNNEPVQAIVREEPETSIECPRCGAPLLIRGKSSRCEYCSSIIANPHYSHSTSTSRNVSHEEAGYEFEKGRQRAFTEYKGSHTSGEYVDTSRSKSVRHNEYKVRKKVGSPRSRLVALLLCVFLGYLGIHRFYVGKIFSGIIYLFTFGGLGVGILIDLIHILTGRFTDRNGQQLIEW